MKKYYKFELNMVIMNFLSIALLFIGLGIWFLLGLLFAPKGIKFNMNPSFFLLLFFLYLVLHEICHGIGYSLFAKNKKAIKYGAALEKGVLYAMCQERINKKALYISLLAPLFILTIIALPLGFIINNFTLQILSVFNLAGAIGDIMMVLFLTKLPKDIVYIDYDNVIGFYLISKEDLSKYKMFGFKYIESGKDSDDLINKDIKLISISKVSYICFAGLLLIRILGYFF